MRVVFMGTPEFSVETLRKLIENHEVIGVVTQPDKPRGRGQNVLFSPVKEFALKNGLKVYQPSKIKNNIDFIEELKFLNPDVIVVVAYGKILPKEIIDMPAYGCINSHASLLPRHRGASPINFAVISGDSKSGITTMFMDEGLDTGDMLLSFEVDIDDEMTAGELHDKLKYVSATAIDETLRAIEKGNFKRIKQNDSLSTYAPILSKEIAHIDFSKSCKEIINFIRGLNPWPIAYCFYKEKKMKVFRAQRYFEHLDNISEFENGQILDVKDEGILVKCLDGLIAITHIQFENKKVMDIKSFLNGNTIEKLVLK